MGFELRGTSEKETTLIAMASLQIHSFCETSEGGIMLMRPITDSGQKKNTQKRRIIGRVDGRYPVNDVTRFKKRHFKKCYS